MQERKVTRQSLFDLTFIRQKGNVIYMLATLPDAGRY
jgi:hypothetical protein